MRLALEPEQKSTETRRRRSNSSAFLQEDRRSLPDFQRHAGNQAIQSLFRSGILQPKLTVGDINDPAEREADAVAAHVMSASADNKVPGRSSIVQRHPGQRKAAPGVPAIVEQVLRSAGQPLDAAVRGYFEPRFGQDFSHVRIHTGPEATSSARSVAALSYTAGSDIVFDSGMYSPESSHGRELLAHELAHVVQQKADTSYRPAGERSIPGSRDTVIHRKPSPTLTQPGEIQDTPKDEEHRRQRVDTAVRTLFGLSGPGLTEANVSFLDDKQFAAQFPARDLVDTLTYIFWYDGGSFSTVPGKILNSYAGKPWDDPFPPNPRADMVMVRNLVHQGIKDGYFWYHFLTDPLTKISPRDLVALYIAGRTEISGPRASHGIKIQMFDHGAAASTLVHETCHFYVSEAYRNAALGRKDSNEIIGSAMISKILFEGFAEYFAREVMDANAEEFGPQSRAYPLEYKQVIRLVQTLGEDSVRSAYFKGAASDIKNLMAVVNKYKVTNPDLLVP